MLPEIKEKIMKHILDTSSKIDNIFASGNKLDIKDLEDLKRYAEVLDRLTSALSKNLY